jgi:hypothetical protein
MNSDSESLQRELLAWLSALDNAEADEYISDACEENYGEENPLFSTATSLSGVSESEWTPQTFHLGEIPTVQNRFQAVLKRRLQTQIQNHPPLFPWETQIREYPEYDDQPTFGLVPALGWAAQLSKLNLPVTLPELVFQQLLSKCQALVASSLPLGAKLVQVVENLFPNEPHALNELAGLVLRSPYRSAASLNMPVVENDYSDLQPRQQMALSLLAAKQLLENLTLFVSPSNPLVERQWLTSAGVLSVKVQYESQGTVTKLRVDADLPSEGTLKLQGDGSQAMAQASNPGSLTVELCCTQLRQAYTLQVELEDVDQQPLKFVIFPTM